MNSWTKIQKNISCTQTPKASNGSNCVLSQTDYKLNVTISISEIHYILVKGTVLQETLTVVNKYTPKTGPLHETNTAGHRRSYKFPDNHEKGPQ